VEAFPGYLAQLGVRLEEGELRRAVLANMNDEKGGEDSFGSRSDRTLNCGSILWKAWVETALRNGGRLEKCAN